MRNKIVEACELSVQLEFDFIEKAFEMGDIDGGAANTIYGGSAIIDCGNVAG